MNVVRSPGNQKPTPDSRTKSKVSQQPAFHGGLLSFVGHWKSFRPVRHDARHGHCCKIQQAQSVCMNTTRICLAPEIPVGLAVIDRSRLLSVSSSSLAGELKNGAAELPQRLLDRGSPDSVSTSQLPQLVVRGEQAGGAEKRDRVSYRPCATAISAHPQRYPTKVNRAFCRVHGEINR